MATAEPAAAPYRAVAFCALLTLAVLAGSGDEARAIVKGTSSQRGSVVRIYAGHYCTGVAIARRLVVTAAHCVTRRMRIFAHGSSIAVAAITRSATLDDGRRVTVQGDAAIARLATPLPAAVTTAPVGKGEGDSYTIAGYGTSNERNPGAFGTLREARLVSAGSHTLVDPHRTGLISASGCLGDSGGPVLRGSMLVGVISRATHPSPRIACGDITRYAPVLVSGEAAETPADNVKASVTTGQRQTTQHALKSGGSKADRTRRDDEARWFARTRAE